MQRDQSEADSTAATTATAASSGAETTATRAATSVGPLSARDEFVIDCLRNARYHEDRERFFATIHKIAMFIVVMSGTATFAWAKQAALFAGFVTLAGALDLVLDISGKARLHAALRRRIYDVLAQAEDPEKKLEILREQAVRIYADEPPCMHAANIIAFNGAMEAFHRPKEYLYKVEWYHRWLRHIWPYDAQSFKTFGEIGSVKS